MRKVIRALGSFFVALTFIGTGIGQSAPPPAVAAYVYSGSSFIPNGNGTGSNPLPFTPPSVALYCQTAPGQPWTPCTGTGGGGGAVSSVGANDSTLTISPTTGAVLAALNLANPNTWTGAQSFGSVVFLGSTSGSITVTAPAVSGVRNITWPTASGAVQLTGAEVVASSATPTFTPTTFQSRNVLTQNVTSFTLAAAASGLPKQLCFQQAASGGPYSVTAPSNVPYFQAIGQTASAWYCQTFAYDATEAIWLPWTIPAGIGTLTQGSYYNTSMFSNGTCTTALTVNPANGNKQSVTLTNGNTCALTFTQPSSGVANVTLKIIQSGTSTFNGAISGCKWPGGVVPTITATTGAVDFLTAYLDGTNAYCVASQNFS